MGKDSADDQGTDERIRVGFKRFAVSEIVYSQLHEYFKEFCNGPVLSGLFFLDSFAWFLIVGPKANPVACPKTMLDITVTLRIFCTVWLLSTLLFCCWFWNEIEFLGKLLSGVKTFLHWPFAGEKSRILSVNSSPRSCLKPTHDSQKKHVDSRSELDLKGNYIGIIGLNCWLIFSKFGRIEGDFSFPKQWAKPRIQSPALHPVVGKSRDRIIWEWVSGLPGMGSLVKVVEN